MNTDTILDFARHRIEQGAAEFSISAGDGLTVGGAFPSFTISGSAAADESPPLELGDLNPLMVVLGKDSVTVTPGYILAENDELFTPTIGGVSIFDTPPPTMPKLPFGGYVWLRRKVVVSVVRDDVLGYNTLAAEFDGGFEILTTPISEPDPDTKFIASAYGAVAFDGTGQHSLGNANYDWESISGEGFLHQMLCSYNSAGKYIERGFGFFDKDHPPGTLTPFPYLWRTADATAGVFGNIIQILDA